VTELGGQFRAVAPDSLHGDAGGGVFQLALERGQPLRVHGELFEERLALQPLCEPGELFEPARRVARGVLRLLKRGGLFPLVGLRGLTEFLRGGLHGAGGDGADRAREAFKFRERFHGRGRVARELGQEVLRAPRGRVHRARVCAFLTGRLARLFIDGFGRRLCGEVAGLLRHPALRSRQPEQFHLDILQAAKDVLEMIHLAHDGDAIDFAESLAASGVAREVCGRCPVFDLVAGLETERSGVEESLSLQLRRGGAARFELHCFPRGLFLRLFLPDDARHHREVADTELIHRLGNHVNRLGGEDEQVATRPGDAYHGGVVGHNLDVEALGGAVRQPETVLERDRPFPALVRREKVRSQSSGIVGPKGDEFVAVTQQGGAVELRRLAALDGRHPDRDRGAFDDLQRAEEFLDRALSRAGVRGRSDYGALVLDRGRRHHAHAISVRDGVARGYLIGQVFEERPALPGGATVAELKGVRDRSAPGAGVQSRGLHLAPGCGDFDDHPVASRDDLVARRDPESDVGEERHAAARPQKPLDRVGDGFGPQRVCAGEREKNGEKHGRRFHGRSQRHGGGKSDCARPPGDLRQRGGDERPGNETPGRLSPPSLNSTALTRSSSSSG